MVITEADVNIMIAKELTPRDVPKCAQKGIAASSCWGPSERKKLEFIGVGRVCVKVF